MTTQPEAQAINLKALFTEVVRITSHQEEVKRLKGESFNLFSILGMESSENATHSAFLGELLNPKGSHLFGSLFLERFLEAITLQKEFDYKSASLILEKHVGTRDDQLKTGGRIDIYLIDANGNTISIENKIYAGDQYAQIERYVNHNTAKNVVYYLTLHGDDASEQSSGELKDGEHYHTISYKQTILQWLEVCLKEATEHPIVRESIRQYIILIKKLTNQLTDSKMEHEIQELIAKNYATVKTLESNIWKVELKATHDFLEEVKSTIELELMEGWTISVDEYLDQSWTGLRIAHHSWNGIIVKLEGASKVAWNSSIYGIAASKDEWNRAELKSNCDSLAILHDGFKESHHWPYYKYILQFGNNEEKAKLFNDEQRKLLVDDVSLKLIDLAKACEIPLANISKV